VTLETVVRMKAAIACMVLLAGVVMASAEKKQRHLDDVVSIEDSLPGGASTGPNFIIDDADGFFACLAQGGTPVLNPDSSETGEGTCLLVSPDPVFIPETTNNFDDHLDGILGNPVSSDNRHDVDPHKSDRHDDQHGHDHHDDHHDKEWSKPSKSKKKGRFDFEDFTCFNNDQFSRMFGTIQSTLYWVSTIIVAIYLEIM